MKIIWTDFASDSLFEIRWRGFVIRVIEVISLNGFLCGPLRLMDL